MTYRYNHRVISLLLVFALLVSLFPGGILPVYTTAAEVSDSNYGAAVHKTAEFNGYFPVPVSDEPSAVSDPFGTDCQQLQQSEVTDDLLLVIAEAYYNADTDCLWYRVEPAPGYTLPAKLSKYSWVFQDYVKNPMGASLLIHEPPCLEHNASGVQVLAGEAFPEGTSLRVQTADASSELAQYGVDSSKLVFSLDIQVLNADSSQWQPENGVTVKVPVSAAPGTTIGLIHNHNGEVSFWGVTEVLADGTVEFYTDRFSEFDGYVVQLQYQDKEYYMSIWSSVYLSEVMAAWGLPADAVSSVTGVTTSNDLVIRAERQTDGDWLLQTQGKFSSPETLTITFPNGSVSINVRGYDVYKITLDCGRHTTATNSFYFANSIDAYYENPDYTLPLADNKIKLPTSYGHTFCGFYTKENGQGTQYIDAQGNISSACCQLNEDTTLYAHWESIKYQIRYKHNYGDIPDRVVDFYYEDNIKFYEPQRDGYTLEGWEKQTSMIWPDEYSWRWSFYEIYNHPGSDNYGSVDLAARWKLNTYTATFNPNGGTVDSATKTYTIESVLELPTPTRIGYSFTGWLLGTGLTSPNGNWVANTYSAGSADTGKYGDVTFVAQWSANPNTAYKVQHWQQTVTGGSEKNTTNYTLVTGDTQNLTGATGASVTPAVKTYTGFKSPSAQTVTIAADGSTVVNYYYDRESYSVTLNKGTGISTVSGAGTYRYGASVTISAALADGYNWSSWTGTHSTTDQSYTFTMPASNVTDTANAAIKTYQVTYQGNGATGGSTGPQTFNHGSSISIAANGFTKTGYHFTGWNTKADGSGTKYAANAVYSTNAALTLYAQWEINTYTVTYVLGFEGTSNITTNASAFPAQAKTHGVDLTLHSGTEPTATGYQFKGWNTKADGSGTTYAPGATYKTDAALILYAQWDPTPYTVTYKINGLPADKASKFEVQYAPINTEVVLHSYSFAGYALKSITAASEEGGQAVAISGGKITMPAGNVVVSVVFETIDYSISYSGLDGAVVIENPATYTVEDTITLHNPTKEGYDFAGWTGTGLTSATETVTIPAGSTGNRAYTATWTEKTYTVTYYANNGSGTSQAVDSFTHGGSLTIAGNLFTNGNSQFVRWNTKPDGSGLDYEPGTVYSVNADLDLYAVWGYRLSINVHSIVDGDDLLEGNISYQGDSWGSTATAVWPANALIGQSLVFTSGEDRIICSVKVVVNGTPVDERVVSDECPYTYTYTFTDALSKDTTIDVYFYARRVSLNAEIDRGSVYYTVAGDSTLYPWQTVHCNPGEHKSADVVFYPASGYSITAVTINGEVDNNPTLNADGSYTYEIGDDGITEDTAITVTTTLNGYTITYDLDGGAVVPENPTAYDVTSPAITLKNPTKEGYTFAGWTGTGLSGATMNVTIPAGSTGNRTYQATWTINQYTMSGVIENGTATSHTVNYGEKATIHFHADSGYRMTGWKTSKGNEGTFSTPTQSSWEYSMEVMDSNVVVTVFTAPIDYTITYHGLEGATVETNAGTYSIQSAAITLNNPSKPGYTFAGWTGTGLSGATMNVTIPAGSIGDRQYTAKWTENTVTIHYETVGPDGATNFGSVNPTTQTVGVVTGQPSSTASVSGNVYKFVGWFDTDGNLLSQNATYNPAPVNGFHVAATYIAKFEYNLTSLTIEKGGWNTADANQTFLFHVRGLDDGVDLVVAVHGDGSVAIDGLTVGYRYTITEMTDWSWRYYTSGWTHGTDSGTGNSATITIGVQGRIVFANNRGIFQWLDGDSWLDNLFSGN